MEYKFINNPTTYKFVRDNPLKKLREDLADTLTWLAGEWDKEPIPIEEAKTAVLGCLDQVEEEGGKPAELLKMRANISKIDNLTDLIKYIWNFKLHASGLRVRM